jgi:hypothetical protein
MASFCADTGGATATSASDAMAVRARAAYFFLTTIVPLPTNNSDKCNLNGLTVNLSDRDG